MLRIVKNIAGQPLFDDFAVFHHTDAVRNLAHDGQVMGDKQHRHAHVAFQVCQQVENLGLDRDIKRGCGLVGDQQLWPVGQRHRDHHTLALPARKLVRISAEPAFCLADADLFQQFYDLVGHRRAAQPLVQLDAFAQLPLDCVQRVQRGHRFLENKADVIAAHSAQVGL